MNVAIGTDELVGLVIDQVWNGGDLEMADTLFTSGYVNHGGLVSDLVRGPEAIKVSVALFRRAFPTFHISVDEVTTDKTDIVVRWVAHCEYPPADAAGAMRGITRCRLQDGKIAESWTSWNHRTVWCGSPERRARREDEGTVKR